MKELPNVEKLPEDKGSKDYFSLISGYPEEKIAFVKESLRNGELPIVISDTSAPSINVLEIGPGGGKSLAILKKEVEEYENKSTPVRLFGIDYVSNLVSAQNSDLTVKGKAQELPFKNESMSVINASAVLHEVNSYSSYGKGFRSVDKTLEEISRVLTPGGIFAYRDVFAPLEGINRPEQFQYKSPAWIGFIKNFTPYFLSHGRQLYQEQAGKIILKQEGKTIGWQKIDLNKNLEINAPLGLFQEIQRHYLTFRDYLLKIRKQEIGVEIIKDQWMDEVVGIKKLTVNIDSKNLENQQIIEKIEKIIQEGNKDIRELEKKHTYQIKDSIIFDQLFDVRIKEVFKRMEQNDEKTRKIFDQWLKREGSEHYFYYNIPEMIIETAELSKKQSDGKYILLPRSMKDIKFISRNYYQYYLNKTLDNSLPEGKQLIKFWKLTPKEAQESLNNLKQSEFISEDMIKRVKILLSK